MRVVRLTALGAALLLAGCQTAVEPAGPMAAQAPPPANYRQIVAAYVRTNFNNPYSIRDASIAAPVPGRAAIEGTFSYETGWGVCMRANARNRLGGYTGIKTTMYIIRDGAVVAARDDVFYETRKTCEPLVYQPFPEIEAGGGPKRG